MELLQIMHFARERGASDIHFTNKRPPLMRIDGDLIKVNDDIMDPAKLEQVVKELTGDRYDEFMDRGELDFTFQAPDGRLRVNVYRQRGIPAAALRVIPDRIPGIDELGLPEVVHSFAKMKQGLVLFTGPTGSGKSTTMAALIDSINNEKSAHILTLEDPIEYIHEHKKSIVNQREVGQDTYSFSNALRAALRQDPDVILVGEMRDLETISIAVTAAETGHLVLGTLHTSTAPATVDRIIDVFPAHQQQQIRVQLAETLRGVVSQRLLPKRGSSGRVCATEILIGTSAIKNLIREGKLHQIPTQMETGSKFGMHTFDQSLKKLADMGVIDPTSF
ncbi:MAG: type IV pilus twitching motility protein PilT [Firmicutes bacterium]|nr:type IV pilus twitching motility protein PilT [Bacillota bacterium]